MLGARVAIGAALLTRTAVLRAPTAASTFAANLQPAITCAMPSGAVLSFG
jgi:hypothetical protein